MHIYDARGRFPAYSDALAAASAETLLHREVVGRGGPKFCYLSYLGRGIYKVFSGRKGMEYKSVQRSHTLSMTANGSGGGEG